MYTLHACLFSQMLDNVFFFINIKVKQYLLTTYFPVTVK